MPVHTGVHVSLSVHIMQVSRLLCKLLEELTVVYDKIKVTVGNMGGSEYLGNAYPQALRVIRVP